MLVHIPDHFSTNLKFNVKKTPSIVTDRSSIGWTLSGWFLGLLMLWLGIFELFSFLRAERNSEQSFLLVEIFAFIVILIALGLIIYSVFSFIRYKKFYFDGQDFQMIYRPSVGVKHSFREPLSNYIGVRLRVLFVQSGLFNKNRYIIDLYHQDSNKIVPLYISTSNKNIRKIWEDYAKTFNLPTLSIGDRGLVERECADLDKSLKDLAKEGKLPYIARGLMPAPDSLDIIEQKNSTIIKPQGIYWDTFSSLFLLIAIAASFVLIAGGVYLAITGMRFPLKYWLCGLFLFLSVIYFAVKLFRSCKLIIKNDRVVVNETVFGFLIGSDILTSELIENIELSYNPTIGRYSLSIVSDEKIINFDSRLPVSDLLWLKDFVIRKLIGN